MALPAYATAHEFWIEPEAAQYQAGDIVTATIRTGEDLQGNSAAFSPRNFRVFDVTNGDTTTPVEGRLGDRPAFQMELSKGLNVIRYWSTGSNITWRTAERFENFLDYDGLEWVLAEHRARGLPEDGFSEVFVRHAKALVPVGNVSGEDKALGMPLEIVARDVPFRAEEAQEFQVLWEGEAIEGVQVALFHRATAGVVSRSVYRTDTSGNVTIDVPAGGFAMLNAVHMVPRADPNTPWQSHWATLSFYTDQAK